MVRSLWLPHLSAPVMKQEWTSKLAARRSLMSLPGFAVPVFLLSRKHHVQIEPSATGPEHGRIAGGNDQNHDRRDRCCLCISVSARITTGHRQNRQQP